ncbi:MAG: hypothetical protein CMP63_06565 [Flavobacteriales bacterium]|nr:hypothetical protein [Flavobacteriales bacterium]|tara:strand:+ start:584 stop:1750 length:1167 start_codon:yes stop_codon:yes gene_type:complete
MKNLSLFFLLLNFSVVSGNWKEVNTPTNEDLNKIEIIDGNAFCGGKNGVLLKSTDQGNTWEEVVTSASGTITSILFVNSSVGFFSTSGGKIFKSTNGGTDWIEKPVHNGGINGIDFKDDLTGIAVGDNGNIFKTTDGGDNWADLGSQSIYMINDVAFINDTTAVAAGANGSYLFTINTGETWTYKSTNQTETYFAVEKKNNTTASIVGTNGSYTEFKEKNLSLDNIQKIDTEGDWLRDIHFIHLNDSTIKGAIAGYNNSFYIENNGWKKWDVDSVINFNGLHFFNDSIGLAAGSNGRIFKTTTGGVPASKIDVIKVRLSLYPNPAKNYLFIEGDFNKNKITIFNSLGQIVMHQTLTKNQIDISNIPNGNYYIQCISSTKIASGIFTKK